MRRCSIDQAFALQLTEQNLALTLLWVMSSGQCPHVRFSFTVSSFL